MSAKHTLVIGSANLDVIAYTDSPFTSTRKKGRVDIAFGGAGHNIAMDYKALGGGTAFMCGLNHSAITQMIINDIEEAGIKLHVLTCPDLPDPIFSGQFYKGDLVSSISAEASGEVIFPDEFIKSGMHNAQAIILCAHFSIEMINHIIAMANKAGTPIYLAVNSEKRALKVVDIVGDIACIYMNEHEMSYLQRQWYPHKDWLAIARDKNCPFVITRGPRGMTVLDPEKFEAIDILVQELEVQGNTLGAGDLIVAATTYHLVEHHLSLTAAVRKSFEKIELILNQNHVHLGEGDALKISIQRAFKQADHDQLTGLLNRHGLRKFMLSDGFRKQRFGLAILDIDHFKQVNDTYGHPAGDSVLCEVAKALSGALREGDVVARWGGEEFICLFINPTKKDALETLQRLLDTVCHTPQAIPQKVTLSAGLDIFSGNQGIEDAIARADIALYRAKQAGRNRVELSEDTFN